MFYTTVLYTSNSCNTHNILIIHVSVCALINTIM
ncbi:hypothetical protein CoNPh10_CDS0005 [Staphylococcus phage S-CoN_Ph10]|nr:hypothetical protein BE22_0081 [Staphylococcus phage vB_SepS_BE22]WNM51402.1 hypothetical protein CoNPh1_CDS0003 [Staphylococcus phage S-CoN_Ph1]WNM51713.1 hypothetical protein CoNPh2_CDS0159 [Staphylococcus phage S-CoN_Ph2]WNM51873.1 hypothetical protein CoNPh3_CDS0159 [Staphylococcus phage S-CoN_Ph3]WNM51879.1 hypothetical protein CoNPh4_CDS0003 [Staphylococcus phage S-CoN_Ph4]WNM52062.1 hypothetical protein CoNPh5_CDS0016 [Staphylococcus phage S-CoN_Ph5]WNM52371.1 hypothetical protein C